MDARSYFFKDQNFVNQKSSWLIIKIVQLINCTIIINKNEMSFTSSVSS